MTSRLATLQKRCTALKEAGRHNEPCRGAGVTIVKLQALIDRLETNSGQSPPTIITPSKLVIEPSQKVNRTTAVIEPREVDINDPIDIDFAEEEPTVREWSNRSSYSSLSTRPAPTNENECREAIAVYDERFYEWLNVLSISENIDERVALLPLSWCNIYKELINVAKTAFDENILYSIADNETNDLLILIDSEIDGDNFADRYPTLMGVFIRAGFLSAKGYLLSHGEANFITQSASQIEELLPYITTTRIAAILYNTYKNIKNDEKLYNSTKLYTAIKDEKNHLSKRGMLLFLAQYELMLSKTHAYTVMQALYDYVVGHDDFIEQILSIPHLTDLTDLSIIASKRHAPNALFAILQDKRLDDSSKSGLLNGAVSMGLIHNVEVLLRDKRVDSTNDNSYKAFLLAARRGDLQLFEILFPKYPPYQERPKLPKIPELRMAAIEGRNYNILQRVLQFPSEDDDEALAKAIESLDTVIISLLLANEETIISWSVDAISQLMEREIDDSKKIEILELLLSTKGLPLPMSDQNFLQFVATHGVPLLTLLFTRRRFSPLVISLLSVDADDANAQEEFDYISKFI